MHRGCNLSWFVEGQGVPVVLIQGSGVGANGWRPQLDALTPRFQCLCFDNRAYGRSVPSAEPLSLELMAEDVLALMDAQGWPSAHLVGHSMGGLIAQYVARRARARVRSLALLCTFANGKAPSRLTPWLVRIGLRTRIGTRRMRRRAFMEMVLTHEELSAADPDTLAEKLGRLFDRDLSESPPILMQQVRTMARADARPFLSELAGIPTLVASAEHDRIATPDSGRELARGLPGARYIELTGTAHAMTITRAAEVNALLTEHLAQAERNFHSATPVAR
ncbi:alpha/beta fold hydrolase [Pyxidicoccus fallax]|uniref:Alpha/beta fold hydrolase n=2 Tax=Pyxidicoccus fallax TaxID=394095 RepID=A0A848L994_9BACT|nr:alpha/beta hydrolase [Pyxidicoccus fallax]NMO15580.1 alpha/beta fold hydrolase [Pyxidicoccus fallax]NPC85249.1 alpha/beta fold hydrolase [Pyxidicoccus fallax]